MLAFLENPISRVWPLLSPFLKVNSSFLDHRSVGWSILTLLMFNEEIKK